MHSLLEERGSDKLNPFQPNPTSQRIPKKIRAQPRKGHPYLEGPPFHKQKQKISFPSQTGAFSKILQNKKNDLRLVFSSSLELLEWMQSTNLQSVSKAMLRFSQSRQVLAQRRFAASVAQVLDVNASSLRLEVRLDDG